jgi:hypothetical protein
MANKPKNYITRKSKCALGLLLAVLGSSANAAVTQNHLNMQVAKENLQVQVYDALESMHND